ncbi:MAG TPA: PilZ domain-containing protein [Nitrospira sp.]|nr:PilZ domain-containing protein [Nitrospira sp.]
MRQSISNNVTTHELEHWLWEFLFLTVLLFPFAIVLALLVGLASWLTGGALLHIWPTGIVFFGTLVLGPLFVRVSCGPDTRVGCARCPLPKPTRLTDRHRGAAPERRRHPRRATRFFTTFSGDDLCGSGMVLDMSAGGCRLKSESPISIGQILYLFISEPGHLAPLPASAARVMWSAQNEFGVMFLHPTSDKQDL